MSVAGPVRVTVASAGVAAPAALRLYLLHHAGGSPALFRGWRRWFPTDWDVRTVAAGGRVFSRTGAPTDDLDALCAALVDHIAEDDAGGPYALFGHSMGGVLAFAAGLAARARGVRAPAWIGVSSGATTAVLPGARQLHRLPSTALRDAVRDLGGPSAVAVAEDGWWRHVEPVLRADLCAVETWRPTPVDAVFDGALSAFCGIHDAVAGPAAVGGWADRTARFLGVREFPGGHFYLAADPGPVVGSIVADVRTALGGPE